MACELFSFDALNQLSRMIHELREPSLGELYRARNDKRSLHFESLQYKELLWAGEETAARTQRSMGAGSANYNATRDGKCAEILMWWTHHLSEQNRVQVSELATLPEMPKELAPESVRSHEYAQQIGCTSCHVAVHLPGKPPVTPIPDKNSTAPQFPVSCPDTAHVWYNRTKRCDWDYEPFCQPCEGIGGLIWGNGEHDWNPMPCTPLLTPDQIPTDNLTSPLWPKSFTVDEYADLSFPGRSPCDVTFRNSTYTLYFDTQEDGPHYHTVGHTGPSGPSPFPGKSWALPNGNFYNTVDIAGHSTFCICITPIDPVVQNAATGPLSYDFNKGAKLVGRELISPEYVGGSMVADHWVKGPHHFWVDVSTNLMIREWQPFNGHQIYHNWNLTRPDPQLIELPKFCYTGLLHHNVSCVSPPPGY